MVRSLRARCRWTMYVVRQEKKRLNIQLLYFITFKIRNSRSGGCDWSILAKHNQITHSLVLGVDICTPLGALAMDDPPHATRHPVHLSALGLGSPLILALARHSLRPDLGLLAYVCSTFSVLRTSSLS